MLKISGDPEDLASHLLGVPGDDPQALDVALFERYHMDFEGFDNWSPR